MQLLVAREQVVRFLAEPEIFDRYFHAVMWSQMMIGSKEGLAEQEGGLTDHLWDAVNWEREALHRE